MKCSANSFVILLYLTIIPTWALSQTEQGVRRHPPPTWRDVPAVKLDRNLEVFWNVTGVSAKSNQREALARGFMPVKLINPFADYGGKPRRPIKPPHINAWDKPARFESIMRRTPKSAPLDGILVLDIEFHFEQNVAKAWKDPQTRAASGATTEAEFREAYLREWASWFVLPARWARQRAPNIPIGIYGPQPFRRDYWGISGKDAQQIDGTHVVDAEMWKFIDPAVDFVISSTYFFYKKPGSLYYMAANIEENVQRSNEIGGKPVYAYESLRFHNSNKNLVRQEIPLWMAEAAAVIPYFSGAKGIVIWGWEPKEKGLTYRTLSHYMRSLKRLEPFSMYMTPDKLVINEPAHVSWNAKRPLIREFRFSSTQSLVMICYPWQEEDETKTVNFEHGNDTFPLIVRGRHTELFYLHNGEFERLEIAPN